MVKKKVRSPLFFYVLLVVAALFFLLMAQFPDVIRKAVIPCANSISCIKNLVSKYESVKYGIFLGKVVKIPQSQIAWDNNVLGEVSDLTKHIYVNLSEQKLYASEDGKVVFSFPISSGKWYPTPTGDFNIWIKLRYTRMSGGNASIGTYYNLPNVPYTMYFYNKEIPRERGFGLHGAYWHNNFGHPMSHGCINISPDNAGILFKWAEVGTPLTIFGQTPQE